MISVLSIQGIYHQPTKETRMRLQLSFGGVVWCFYITSGGRIEGEVDNQNYDKDQNGANANEHTNQSFLLEETKESQQITAHKIV